MWLEELCMRSGVAELTMVALKTFLVRESIREAAYFPLGKNA
jgi:hypothetical protein